MVCTRGRLDRPAPPRPAPSRRGTNRFPPPAIHTDPKRGMALT
jgi:hypothetical protein